MKDLTDFQRLQSQPINSLLDDFFDENSAINSSELLQFMWHRMFDDEAAEEELSALEISNLSYNLNRVVALLHELEKYHIETKHEEKHLDFALKLKELESNL